MSLDQPNKVDAIGLDNETDQTVLTIADSWDWNDEPKHLIALQAKLNAYLEFIESGQVWDEYPTAKGKNLRIDVVFRYPPPAAATSFIAKAADTVKELEILLTYRIFHKVDSR